jgi:hypothetical protein
MRTKRLNEEIIPKVLSKTKKVPFRYQEFWERGMTVGKLKELINDLPDNMPAIGIGTDHTYELISIKISTALFDSKEQVINEDHGENLTPEAKYGKRKEVLIIQ